MCNNSINRSGVQSSMLSRKERARLLPLLYGLPWWYYTWIVMEIFSVCEEDAMIIPLDPSCLTCVLIHKNLYHIVEFLILELYVLTFRVILLQYESHPHKDWVSMPYRQKWAPGLFTTWERTEHLVRSLVHGTCQTNPFKTQLFKPSLPSLSKHTYC